MWGAKWEFKRIFFSHHFLTIFVRFFTFRPKNRKIAKNGQKMAGEKNPFKFLLLTHFAPTCQKLGDYVGKHRNGTTFVQFYGGPVPVKMSGPKMSI